MLWNLPFNGISVAMGGITVDKIMRDPSLRRLAELIMDETTAIGMRKVHCVASGFVTFAISAHLRKMLPLSLFPPHFVFIYQAHADLESHLGSGGYEPLHEEDKFFCMKLSDTMGPYKTSTMLDLKARRPMEVEYLFNKPLQRANRLGVPVPHLETVVAQIRAFQRMYKLF